jgi:hypothetical protein
MYFLHLFSKEVVFPYTLKLKTEWETFKLQLINVKVVNKTEF